jgi:hypothetical protein
MSRVSDIVIKSELQEIWGPIIGYEGIYEISNFGRAKSLERIVKLRDSNRTVRERILNPNKNHRTNYYHIKLFSNCEGKTFQIHTLVWDHFGDRKRDGLKLQVDHIDGNKLNNRIDNLQILTSRENLSKGHVQRGRKLPTGVDYHKKSQKYRAQIRLNGEGIHLGIFNTKESAHQAYIKAIGGQNE